MTSPKPTRQQADLADVLELVLDKGIVVNADIAVTVNETELLGVEIRAAIASFETAAEYGLAFPSGTDMERVEAASGRESLDDEDTVDLGIGASEDSAEQITRSAEPPGRRPAPRRPVVEGADTEAGEAPDTGDDETHADSAADEMRNDETDDDSTDDAEDDA